MSRQAQKYNESPVFGLAGIILPEDAIRPFATKFLQFKEHLFEREIKKSGKPASHWEKHGSRVFTPKSVARYPHLRSAGFRILNHIRDCGGQVFYYGREKIVGTTDVRSIGLYKTVLAHTIRQLEKFGESVNANYIMVVDEHSAHKELLITALKTMYGVSPARHMLSPPFEVESHFNQNIQAADWVAAIVGRLWNYELLPDQFSDHQDFRKYFWRRVHQVVTHSRVLRR